MPSSHPHRAGRVRKPDDKFRTPLKKAQAAVPDQEGALPPVPQSILVRLLHHAITGRRCRCGCALPTVAFPLGQQFHAWRVVAAEAITASPLG